MKPSRSIRRAAFLWLGISFLPGLTGCSHWVAQSAPPADVLARHRPRRILVHPRQGRSFVLWDPAASDSFLTGYRGYAEQGAWGNPIYHRKHAPAPRDSIPLAQVGGLERSKSDVLLFLGLGGGAVSIIYLFALFAALAML